MVPRLSAVSGAKYAALLLRSRDAAGHAGVHGFSILRMDDDAADAAALHDPQVLPGGAGVDGLVDPVALHIAVANRAGFAGAGPYGLGIGGCDGEGADRHGRLLIEDR